MQSTEKKNSFILYHSFRSMFSETTPEQCQKLIMAIFDFSIDGVLTDFTGDPLLKICYDQIIYLVSENKRKYEQKLINMSIAAKKREGDKKKRIEEYEQVLKDESKPLEERKEALNGLKEEYGYAEEDLPFV